MAKMVSVDIVNQIIDDKIKHLNIMCNDWGKSLDSCVDSYCDKTRINGATSLVNVGNVVNHVGEIKALKASIENLEIVKSLIDSASKYNNIEG